MHHPLHHETCVPFGTWITADFGVADGLAADARRRRGRGHRSLMTHSVLTQPGHVGGHRFASLARTSSSSAVRRASAGAVSNYKAVRQGKRGRFVPARNRYQLIAELAVSHLAAVSSRLPEAGTANRRRPARRPAAGDVSYMTASISRSRLAIAAVRRRVGSRAATGNSAPSRRKLHDDGHRAAGRGRSVPRRWRQQRLGRDLHRQAVHVGVDLRVCPLPSPSSRSVNATIVSLYF